MKTFILILLIFLIAPLCFAETIVLKSGKSVEGKLIEKTDKYIKLDFQGVELIYFFDDIESIDGKRLFSVESKIKPSSLNNKETIVKSGLVEADSYFQEGYKYLEKEDYASAINYFQKSLAINPSHTKAFAYIGLAHYYLRNKSLAETNFLKAKELCTLGDNCKEISFIDKYIGILASERMVSREIPKNKMKQLFSMENFGNLGLYGVYMIIYPLMIIVFLFFRFSSQGISIAIAGSIASLIASFVFHDVAVANTIAYVCSAIETYFFLKIETD